MNKVVVEKQEPYLLHKLLLAKPQHGSRRGLAKVVLVRLCELVGQLLRV